MFPFWFKIYLEIKYHKNIKCMVVEKKDVLIIKDSNIRVRKWFQNTTVLQTFCAMLGNSFRIEYPKITRLRESLRWHEGNFHLLKIENAVWI